MAMFLCRFFCSICLVALHVAISVDALADTWQEVAVAQCVLCAALLAYELLQLRNMLRQSRILNWASLYNLLDMSALSLAFIVAQPRAGGDASAPEEVVCAATIVIWLHVLFYLRGFEATSAMIRMIIEVIHDATPFFATPPPQTQIHSDEVKALRMLKAR